MLLPTVVYVVLHMCSARGVNVAVNCGLSCFAHALREGGVNISTYCYKICKF